MFPVHVSSPLIISILEELQLDCGSYFWPSDLMRYSRFCVWQMFISPAVNHEMILTFWLEEIWIILIALFPKYGDRWWRCRTTVEPIEVQQLMLCLTYNNTILCASEGSSDVLQVKQLLALLLSLCFVSLKRQYCFIWGSFWVRSTERTSCVLVLYLLQS